ncbi:MAG: tRNA lysidine(34) synthetase TilS [Geobacter sp.]|nr:tRNA lysidine(34) synthetase TilS [Geobacter sp.]
MNPFRNILSEIAGHTISEQGLLPQGSTVVVAVSGGIDSVVLLDYLVSRTDLGLSLVVAHLNHCLRGEESDGDEAFVRQLAASHGLAIEVDRVDVRQLAAAQRLSLEEAGREERYRFFAGVAKRYGAAAVALAHHRDDQAETVLLRLLRGSGTAGLAAMLPRSTNGDCIRPLLHVGRAEIEAYAREKGLSFRTDSSNSDTGFLRNRVRHSLIPDLETYNPAISRRLADTAALLAADEELLNAVVALRWPTVAHWREGAIALSRAVLLAEVAGMRFRIYRRALAEVKGDLRRIAFCHLQAIDRLLAGGPPNGTLDLPGGIQVTRCYDELFVGRSGKSDGVADYAVTIAGGGCYRLPLGGRIEVSTEATEGQPGRNSILVDLDAVPFPWLVRSFRPGDRLVPVGMSGQRKVKELFIDEKIPRGLRCRIPLVFSGTTLFWVAGLRMAASARPVAADSRIARVELLDFVSDPVILA